MSRGHTTAGHEYPEIPAETLLTVEDLRTTFDTPRGKLTAVDGVSFELEAGRTLGVVGESGSGKTVLSRSVMRLLPKRGATSTGRVRFNGHEMVGLTQKQLRGIWGTELAMVFQDPMTSLNPTMRIGNQITESLRYHLGMSSSEATEHAVVLLSSVGIPTPERRLHDYPHQLSGGLRQRVTIAIALACGPRLLFADEPTTALDVTVQAQILDLLAAQQRERSMAMILVTHDLGVVAGRTDDIAVMYGGKIVEQAPTNRATPRCRPFPGGPRIWSAHRLGAVSPRAARTRSPAAGMRSHPCAKPLRKGTASRAGSRLVRPKDARLSRRTGCAASLSTPLGV